MVLCNEIENMEFLFRAVSYGVVTRYDNDKTSVNLMETNEGLRDREHDR